MVYGWLSCGQKRTKLEPSSLQWAISQVLSYSLLAWLAFVSIAGGAAYLGKWRGVLIGLLAIALLVSFLDVAYQSSHSKEMDMDAVFAVGMIDRVLLINAVLLPVHLLGLFAAYHRKTAKPAA